jgi:thaumarchaeosortase
VVRKYWFHIFLLASVLSAISLLMFLDYFNLESIQLFNDRGFFFEYTWKGRMFLLIFSMLFVIESMLGWDGLKPNFQQKHRSLLRMILISLFALLPLIYIISINFFGLSQTVLSVGESLRGAYWKAQSPYWYLILGGDWPLVLEYIVFSISFLFTILLAYGKLGLRSFSITLSLVAGIAIFYFIDMWFPYGAFWPFQIFTRPTAALAGFVLKNLGFQFSLVFPASLDASPILTTQAGLPLSVTVEWVCAGVHSLLLYSLIILLFFKKSAISTRNKIGYFVIGAIGTFLANVLRVVTYFAVLANQGLVAAGVFHDTYGELFFAGWMLLYISLITVSQKFQLPEKVLGKLPRIGNRWRPENVS